MFYSTCIRPILEYSCQAFHYGLPEYLSLAIELVQKRVLSIIYPSAGSYTGRFQISSLDSLYNRRRVACMKLFNDIKDNSDRKLFSLLPPRYIPNYNLRRSRDFVYPSVKTEIQ